MLPLAADEDVNGNIIRGVRRREPKIDLVRVQDVFPPRTPDPVLLDWAATEGRILITQDENTLIGNAWDRVRAGRPMAGVLVRGKSVTIRQAIYELIVVALCGTSEDFKDQVLFLPL
jgi:hypothetical protein